MSHQDLTNKLRDSGFNRVERDDRLLDIFPRETAEKGVELWEKWEEDTVELVRIHNSKETHHSFQRVTIEHALQENIRLTLE